VKGNGDNSDLAPDLSLMPSRNRIACYFVLLTKDSIVVFFTIFLNQPRKCTYCPANLDLFLSMFKNLKTLCKQIWMKLFMAMLRIQIWQNDGTNPSGT
jgi:hypothetical protein